MIQERRSVRKFLPTPVSKELIYDVLAAAGLAPSAHNAQPYRFIILEDAQIKQKLADEMARVWAADLLRDGLTIDADKQRERVERFAKAPVLILACVTGIDGLPSYSDERRQTCIHDLAVQSLGAAIENLLLAAHAKSLGACWFSAPCFCKEAVKKTLRIPDSVEPQALIAMGYPAETPLEPKKKSVEDYCFLDVWGKKL